MGGVRLRQIREKISKELPQTPHKSTYFPAIYATGRDLHGKAVWAGRTQKFAALFVKKRSRSTERCTFEAKK